MSMPTGRRSVDGSARIQTLSARATSESSETASICLRGSREANRNLNTDNARVLRSDGYLNLIDARYLNGRWKVIEATDVAWGIIQRCRIDLTEMSVSLRGCRQYRTGVRRQNGRLGKISMLKMPSAANQFARWQIWLIHDRKFETFQTLGNERPDAALS